jgi:hypothetical protein
LSIPEAIGTAQWAIQFSHYGSISPKIPNFESCQSNIFILYKIFNYYGEYKRKKIFDLKIFFDPQKNPQILKIDQFWAFLGVLNSLSFFSQ